MMISSTCAVLLPPAFGVPRLEIESDRHHRSRRERSQLVVEVSMTSDHNFYAGLSLDVADGGLFVATHMPGEIGSSVVVVVTLPDEIEPILMVGEVDWVRSYQEDEDVPPGMGIRFVALSADATAVIARFVESRQPILWE